MDKQVQRLSARRPVESFDEAALVLQQIIRAEMRGTVAATRVLSALRRVQSDAAAGKAPRPSLAAVDGRWAAVASAKGGEVRYVDGADGPAPPDTLEVRSRDARATRAVPLGLGLRASWAGKLAWDDGAGRLAVTRDEVLAGSAPFAGARLPKGLDVRVLLLEPRLMVTREGSALYGSAEYVVWKRPEPRVRSAQLATGGGASVGAAAPAAGEGRADASGTR